MNPVETLAPGRTSGKPQPVWQCLSDGLTKGGLSEDSPVWHAEALPLESTKGKPRQSLQKTRWRNAGLGLQYADQ